jgi:hypothetical protein
MEYKSVSGYWAGQKHNKQYRSCYYESRTNVNITKQKAWIVPCIVCGKKRKYRHLQHYYRARDIYQRCQSCAKKEQIQSNETREKRRLGKRTTFVSYNPIACQIFEEINKELGWSGKHAENGGEFQVLQFHLDYYEPIHKIIIEYDEPHHKKPKNRQRDGLRQK